MDASSPRPHRTGWVILVLMVASNFMAWMEPVVSVTAGIEAVSPGQLRMSVAACLVAATLVTATWLTGRHSSSRIPSALSPPRLMGFRMALATAAVNIVLGIAIATIAPRASLDAYRVSLAIQGLWFLVVLPGEVVSAYLTGRGTVRAVPAPVVDAA